jgi:hypothetical protein
LGTLPTDFEEYFYGRYYSKQIFGQSNSAIDLTIPLGTDSIYTAKKWTGFKSISYTTLTTSLFASGVKILNEGDSSQYKVTIVPANATDKGYLWKSLAPNILSISPSGLAKALQAGKTKVIAYQSSLADTIDVTVKGGSTHLAEPEVHPAVPQAPQNQVVLYSIRGKRLATMSELQWDRFRATNPISQLYLVKVYSPEGVFLRSYKAVK